MTEEEAKTKHCPMTLPRSGSIGERGQIEKCLGSACMAWRWKADEGTEYVIRKSGEPQPEGNWTLSSKRTGFSDQVFWERPSGDGYCGLAGKP